MHSNEWMNATECVDVAVFRTCKRIVLVFCFLFDGCINNDNKISSSGASTSAGAAEAVAVAVAEAAEAVFIVALALDAIVVFQQCHQEKI
jgi:hypothetical protein